MKYFCIPMVVACLFVGVGSVSAQTCGGAYSIRSGDTLSGIAATVYGRGSLWGPIYNQNIEEIGRDPDLIRIGDVLRIPCIDPEDAAETADQAVADLRAEAASTQDPEVAGQGPQQGVTLLTAGDYAPFTDESLSNGGLVTEIVDNLMAVAPDVAAHQIVWINDWSAHLNPLLSEGVYDLGFPWLQPDCTQTPTPDRCANFRFSEPMFEMLIMLFVRRGDAFPFDNDSDIVGRTLCRPAGYYTHDLEKGGRNWVSEGLITLEQPNSVAACFELLTAGAVDAVALNEFTGNAAVRDLQLTDQVEVLGPRPLSIEGLHVLVHREHPGGEALIQSVNAGLDRLRSTGTYQAIVDRHLAEFWDSF